MYKYVIYILYIYFVLLVKSEIKDYRPETWVTNNEDDLVKKTTTRDNVKNKINGIKVKVLKVK